MKNKVSYVFRIDDVCPEINWKNFDKLVYIFNKYKIKAILGVIPKNKDKTISVNNTRKDYWNYLRELVKKGWIVSQHGFNHSYINKDPGLLGITKQSEFVGLSYSEQYKKIHDGKNILEKKLKTRIEWWMAPSHSFDKTTCEVLKKLKFKYITDGFYLNPVFKYGLVWVPQQLWSPRKMLFGMWTICIHPNSFTDFGGLENFIKKNINNCQNIKFNGARIGLINKIFDKAWHLLLFLSRI